DGLYLFRPHLVRLLSFGRPRDQAEPDPLLVLRGLPRRRRAAGAYPAAALRPLARSRRPVPRRPSRAHKLYGCRPPRLQLRGIEQAAGGIDGMPAASYVHGASPVPLLGETIGENLRRTVERVPQSEALVLRQQNYRATYAQLWEQTTRAARAL